MQLGVFFVATILDLFMHSHSIIESLFSRSSKICLFFILIVFLVKHPSLFILFPLSVLIGLFLSYLFHFNRHESLLLFFKTAFNLPHSIPVSLCFLIMLSGFSLFPSYDFLFAFTLSIVIIILTSSCRRCLTVLGLVTRDSRRLLTVLGFVKIGTRWRWWLPCSRSSLHSSLHSWRRSVLLLSNGLSLLGVISGPISLLLIISSLFISFHLSIILNGCRWWWLVTLFVYITPIMIIRLSSRARHSSLRSDNLYWHVRLRCRRLFDCCLRLILFGS